jgi:hypothetical protein
MIPANRTLLTAISIFFLAGSQSETLASPINDWRGNLVRQPISESTPDVTWSIETTDETLVPLAQAAVQKWQDVDSAYITFTQVESSADGRIRFQILDSLSNAYAGGQALVTWSAEGEIDNNCTIELLASALNSGGDSYREMLLTHEFGHCLGLSHAVVNGAVMSYRNPGADLTIDDRFALTLLYPATDAALPLGCASLSRPSKGGHDGESDPRFGGTLLLLALLTGGFLRIRLAGSSKRRSHPTEAGT